MRFNPYDDVYHKSSAVSSVAIKSLTGSSAVNGDSFDTVAAGLESLMVHVRAEIASGSPSASTVAWKLQESANGSTGWGDAQDNTGTVIGATLDVNAAAVDSYARVEGINLYNGASAAPFGGRKRYLRIVLTPTFTSGSSPAILAYAQFIGALGNGAQFPARTTTSNT